MQKITVKIIFILFLLVGSARAQSVKDSFPVSGDTCCLESDSLHSKMHFKKMKIDSLHSRLLKKAKMDAVQYRRLDSLPAKFRNFRLDSLPRKIYRRNIKMDSLRFKKGDSLHFALKKMKADSMRMDMHFKVKMDSFHFKMDTLHKFRKVKLDTLNAYRKPRSIKRDSFHFKKMDSLHFYYKSVKFDSGRMNMRFKKIIVDSMHFRFKMKRLDSCMKRLKTELKKCCDSSNIKKQATRSITMQFNCGADAVVSVLNLSRKIYVRTGANDLVKLVAHISGDEANGIADEALFRRIGIESTGNAGEVTIQRAQSASSAMSRNPTNKINGSITIYIPASARLNIDNSNADVVIENDIKDVNIKINNGNLVMGNAEKAVIRSSKGSIKAVVIKDADIDLAGCQFVCESIDQLKINSKYSNVSFVRSSALSFKSVSDRYEIQQVTDVQGDKTFGELSISNLKNSFVLSGSSADVKINNIELKAALIKIDNKYADIYLPVTKLPNYSVDFDGVRSNVSAPFEKHFVRTNAVTTAGNTNINSGVNFTAAVGNVNNGHTKFQINCNSCIVDFN